MNSKLVVVTSLLFTVFLFLFSGLLLAFDLDFYLLEGTIYPNSLHQNKTLFYSNLISYFNNAAELSSFYSFEEAGHLHDVKNLIHSFLLFLSFLFLVLMFLFCYFFSKKPELLSSFFILSFFIATFIIFLFSFLSFFSFDLLFDKFHRLFFIHESWIFSADSLLIQLFPLEFFVDAFKRILAYFFFFSFSFFSLGILLKEK